FGNGIIVELEKADKRWGKDAFPTFGKLNLRTQRGTCYAAECLDSNRHAISYGEALCYAREGRKAKQQKKVNSHQEHEQHTEQMRQRALSGDDEQQTPLHNSLVLHEQTDVLEAQTSGEPDQGDSAVAQDSHDHDPVLVHSVPGAAEAVRLSSTFFNE
ncbi:unnamed protein product, partial [Urochloa humidicola]